MADQKINTDNLTDDQIRAYGFEELNKLQACYAQAKIHKMNLKVIYATLEDRDKKNEKKNQQGKN